MPPNSNPDIRGEGVRLYYRLDGEYDTTQTDAAILGDAGWLQLCQVTVNTTRARDLEATEDACSADEIGYTAGRVTRSASATLNEFRLTSANVRAFDDLVGNTGIIPILTLTADIDDPAARGEIMNALVGQNDKTSPQKGLVTRSVEFKPAARTEFGPRDIYGADIT